jgi:hypothetical protein
MKQEQERIKRTKQVIERSLHEKKVAAVRKVIFKGKQPKEPREE